MKKYIFTFLALLATIAHAQIVPDYLRHPSATCASNKYVQYPTAGSPATCKQVAYSEVTGTPAAGVTSVALSLPSIITVSGSPVTTTGTLTGSLATETANTIFAGPSGGAAAAPTFRTFVADDILTGGANGRALTYDGSTTPKIAWAPASTDYRYGYFEQDHFLQGVNISGNKTKSVVSGGAGASVFAKTGLGAMHSGSYALQTRATNDLAGMWGTGVANSNPFFASGDGTYEVDWWFNVEVLATSTERFRVDFGMNNQVSPLGGAGSYGFFANYQDNGTPAGKTSILVYFNGTAQTQVQGTTTIVANTWYRVRLVADIVNANIKEYLFTPGGTETLEATYTGTMPTSVPMAPLAEMFRSVGTAGNIDRVVYTTGWQVATSYATQQ